MIMLTNFINHQFTTEWFALINIGYNLSNLQNLHCTNVFCINQYSMSPWTAWIRFHHQVHQPAAGLTPTTEVGDLPLDIKATPDTHAMNTETDQ